MSKIIDNRLLDKVGNPKKLIEQSLENQIRQVEAGMGEDASGLISKTLLLFIPKEGKYLQLHEAEIEEKLLNNQNISSSQIQNVLNRLNEVGILTSQQNGNYEIASAVLASHIFEKIESENRVLRKVETFIHDRFSTFRENKNLLNQDDLNYINPYLSSISISTDEAAFIEKSKTKISRRRRYLIMAVIVIVSALAALAFSAFLQSQEAQKQRDIAENASLELKDANEELEKAKQSEIDKNQLLASNNKELDEAKRKAEKESDDNKKLAAENKRLAKKAQEEADRNAGIAKMAKRQEMEAINQKKIADKTALENIELAKIAEAEAEKNALLAKQNADLNAIILSRKHSQTSDSAGRQRNGIKGPPCKRSVPDKL